MNKLNTMLHDTQFTCLNTNTYSYRCCVQVCEYFNEFRYQDLIIRLCSVHPNNFHNPFKVCTLFAELRDYHMNRLFACKCFKVVEIRLTCQIRDRRKNLQKPHPSKTSSPQSFSTLFVRRLGSTVNTRTSMND